MPGSKYRQHEAFETTAMQAKGKAEMEAWDRLRQIGQHFPSACLLVPKELVRPLLRYLTEYFGPGDIMT